MIKECQEEAGLSPEIASKCIPCGTVSYFLEGSKGLSPELQFVFDLELPLDFVPKAEDGEVSAFYHLTPQEVMEKIVTEEFKPNCALVLLDFFIRRGFVEPDAVKDYPQLVSSLRLDIYSLDELLNTKNTF